jgi:hypothetical protein
MVLWLAISGLPLPALARQSVPVEAQLAAAHALGKRIHAYDRAAWVASDALVEQVPKAQLTQVRGWVVTPDGEDLIVTFQSGAGAAAKRFFIVRVRSGIVVETDKPTEQLPLSETEMALVRARDVAAEEVTRRDFRACTPARFNSVVLPPEAPGQPIRAYFLSAQVSSESWPMGGHYLVLIDSAGQVQSSRRFTNSCIAMPAPKKGQNAPMFVITHLLDPAPTEIHAFTTIASGVPIMVATSDRNAWRVTGAGISFAGKLGN